MALDFPEVNDYRNPVIAEAMKVLGYVNRYNRGIVRMQKELAENGNGKAIFDLNLITAFKVIEPISIRANTKLTDRQLATLEFCRIPKSREEILAFLGLTNQTKNYVMYVQPLLDANFLEYTISGKANIKGQKYILSSFGKDLIEKGE